MEQESSVAWASGREPSRQDGQVWTFAELPPSSAHGSSALLGGNNVTQRQQGRGSRPVPRRNDTKHPRLLPGCRPDKEFPRLPRRTGSTAGPRACEGNHRPFRDVVEPHGTASPVVEGRQHKDLAWFLSDQMSGLLSRPRLRGRKTRPRVEHLRLLRLGI